MKYIFGLLLLYAVFSCGSKKSVHKSNVKEGTDIELTDNSRINKKIEQEQQLVNTNTKERIVTFYGMQLVPYPVNGDTIYLPVSYPVKKEEDRETSEQLEKWKTTVQDSIQNAIELKYKSQIDEKNKNISEFKETKTLYHIALIVLGVFFVLILVLRK